MSIRHYLASWNGKSADDIGDVYERHCADPSFVSDLLELAGDEALQKGATWLLKRHLENNEKLDPEEIEQVYALLPGLTRWESRLHILQCMPHMPVPEARRVAIEAFLRASMTDEVKFVRAWAYGGYWGLARQFPEYRAEAERLCEIAMHHEAPSVKARLRQVMKAGF
ncbi:MAG: hypothetical protein MPJ78_11460 [Hyphomicrobiaceae bacterium]|nr:hypothetical protein [Hyphomicrobiaceae bacterium]